MGKGHKERRREQRARELEEREVQLRELKSEIEKTEEILPTEKLVETSSDTDSGHGSSSTIASIDSPKPTTDDSPKPRASIKGLMNIGNTCFFNVIIQSLVHTPVLIEQLHRIKLNLIEEDQTKYFSTLTAQLIKIINDFTSNEQKKSTIDPKSLFNSLIQRIPLYKGYDQHDSHELFMNLMFILRAEEIQLRKLKAHSTDDQYNEENDPSKMFCLIGCNEPQTTYDSIFGGHLLDVLTCKKCGKSLMKIEPFLGILLPLTDRAFASEVNRSRRKRDEYFPDKSKKEPKTLSKKQQRAAKKQEKKNSRKVNSAGGSKIRNRQTQKKNLNDEILPKEEEAEEENREIIETCQVKEDESVENSEKPTIEVNENPEETEKNEDPEEREKNENPEETEKNEDPREDGESENEQVTEGPLTSTESTCVLADLVSSLTLIHENASRPLPFVNENIAQQFLNVNQIKSQENEEVSELKTLEDCFHRYFKMETLSGENSFDCYYCRSLEKEQKKVFTEATRQTAFFQLPPVLPVFLKRFQMCGSRSEKIQKFIQFPLQLDLAYRCSPQINTKSSMYSLYAVIEHMGTLRSGHYVVYIKPSTQEDDFSDTVYSQPVDKLLNNLFHPEYGTASSFVEAKKSEKQQTSSTDVSWYHISDNTIHKVPESRVLEADAYVLFYRRIEIQD